MTGKQITIATVVLVSILLAIAGKNFVRARQAKSFQPCVASLRQISAAKAQWATENKKEPNETPSWEVLLGYLNHQEIPKCPEGGVYIIGDFKTTPRCSIGGVAHSIRE